jgi:peroxiredoxin
MESEITEIGTPAPDFVLPSTQGERIRLSELRGNSRVILYFIRAFN